MPTLDIMNALKVSGVAFIPQWRQEFSRKAGGTPRAADLGPEIWMAKIACGVMTHNEAKQASALINKLRGAIGTFYVYDPRAQFPQADPSGSILGASTVTISELGGDNHSLRLTGLPPGYQITLGDKLSWDQGSSPNIHRCLHEFSASATADGSGVLPLTEVAPHIRTGASVGLAVTLIRPAAEMFIPGSYDFPSTGPTTSSIGFTAMQVP